MKRQILTTMLLGFFSSASAMVPAAAHANNRSVENELASYADDSVFYQALINTGVISELNENTHYTIFAPTNEAFEQIRPDRYPCFYSVQCRAQVADVLRNHIVIGRRTLKELTNEAEVQTIGRNRIYAESPYVHQYTVGSRDVLNGGEFNGNMIYRIDGVILTNAQLAQFRTVPPVASNGQTIVMYPTPAAYPVPGGDSAGVQEVSVYPDGTRVTTVRHTYVTPDGILPGGGEETTVTRTISSQP